MFVKFADYWFDKIMTGRRALFFRAVTFFIFALPLILLAVFSYIKIDRELTSSAFSEKRAIALLSASIIDEKLDALVNLSTSFATRKLLIGGIEKGDWTEAVDYLKGVDEVYPFIDRIFLFDKAGAIRACVPFIPEGIGESRLDRKWYQAIRKNLLPTVSEVYRRGTKPTYNIVAVAVPIFSQLSSRSAHVTQEEKDKALIGILLVHVRLSNFGEWIAKVNVGSHGLIYIVDQYGHIVFHPKLNAETDIIDFSSAPLIQKLLKGKRGAEVNYNPIEKEERVAAYEPINAYGWGVVVTQPKNMAFAYRNRNLFFILSISSLIVMIWFFLFLSVLYIFIQRRKSENIVRESEEKFRDIFETSRDFIFRSDMAGNILDANAAALAVTGYSVEELKKINIKDLYADVGQRAVYLPKLLAQGFIEDYELKGRKRDGMIRDILITAIVRRDKEKKIIGFHGNIRDISERKKAEMTLLETNKKLKELDELKSYFLAIVSHEFKNPLTVIKESLALILEQAVGSINAQQAEMLALGKKHIERLGRLVTDLLDVSKIEAGKMEMKKESLDISGLVKDILDFFEPEIKRKNIQLVQDTALDPCLVWADKDRLGQVFLNLLSNAVKYTPSGGRVGVHVGLSEDGVRIEVSDTGPGIAKENLLKIFDKFGRIGVEKQEGTGLGLLIAKNIIELHQGRIWVESELGRGSVFIFTLPKVS